MKTILEICVDSVESFLNAINGGANRIELCSALSEGGLTPTPGFLQQIQLLNHLKIPIFCMLRCRKGFDFNYSKEEIDIMIEDAKILRQKGADGFVFGALNEHFDVDLKKCHAIMKTCYPLPVTFHRAFDVCKNPTVALESIIDIGFKRILTSGQCKNALDGAENIKKIKEIARDKIIIMAGSGINENNLQKILDITNVTEIHGSASVSKSIINDRNELNALMTEDVVRITTQELVHKLRKIIDNYECIC